MKWFLKALKHYADFSGRARRKEFWMFVLFYMIFCYVTMALDKGLGINFKVSTGQSLPYGWFYTLYSLMLLIPSLAVYVRRMHDIGKSGWNILFGLLPLIGVIILLYWCCRDSQAGENKWGTNPKEQLESETN